MSEEKTNSGLSGCFGCLTEIIGILGVLYVLFHWGQIWSFVIGK